MADSTVLTETEKSNRLINMRVMMTIMCISSPSSILGSSINWCKCLKQLPFSILHENTPGPPPSALLWHFEFSCILFILSGNARHAEKRVLTVRQKQMTFIRREMKRRIYVYCVSLPVCVVLGFPLCRFMSIVITWILAALRWRLYRNKKSLWLSEFRVGGMGWIPKRQNMLFFFATPKLHYGFCLWTPKNSTTINILHIRIEMTYNSWYSKL